MRATIWVLILSIVWVVAAGPVGVEKGIGRRQDGDEVPNRTTERGPARTADRGEEEPTDGPRPTQSGRNEGERPEETSSSRTPSPTPTTPEDPRQTEEWIETSG